MRASTGRHCAVVNAVADIVVDVDVVLVVLVGIVTPFVPSYPAPAALSCTLRPFVRVRREGGRTATYTGRCTRPLASLFRPLNRHSAPPRALAHGGIARAVGKKKRCRLLASNTLFSRSLEDVTRGPPTSRLDPSSTGHV